MGKTSEKEWMYICVCVYVYVYFTYIDLATYLIHFAVHLKLTHCKSTILQSKIKYFLKAKKKKRKERNQEKGK